MLEKPVIGEVALKKMAQQALNQPPSSSKDSEEEKDPLQVAQDFTRRMAANAIIDSEVAKSQASADKAKAEADEAKTKAERAKSGESAHGDSPVKITGEISMGKINYQEMLEKQVKDRDELRVEAEKQAGAQAAVSDDLRERLHASEMEVLKTSFAAQMQVLTKMIETNGSQGTFMEQYQSVMGMAKELGLNKQEGSSDLAVTIELKKLEFEHSREERKARREDRSEERRWQLELRRLDDDRDARKAEGQRQDKRDEMFANAPKAVGSMLAQGIMAMAGEEGISEAHIAGNSGHVEAGVAEGGEIECEACKEPVAIGSTARMAVCAKCGKKYSIKRIQGTTEEEDRR